MAEYIEREVAIDFVQKYTPNINGETTLQCVKIALENTPTADVVEVVRCKDCKFYKLRNVSSRYKPTKPCCLRTATIKVNETDFCSYGEKRSEDKQ